jgi:hypothetical protein
LHHVLLTIRQRHRACIQCAWENSCPSAVHTTVHRFAKKHAE